MTEALPNNSSSSSQYRGRTAGRTPKVLPTTTSAPDSREIETVVFVPYTIGGQLRKQLQKIDDQTTKVLGMGRTKYVERAGVSMIDTLVDKNIWLRLQQGCGRQFCYPCKSSKGQGISCRLESICYSISCRICEREEMRRVIYYGETSRSACERLYEHFHMFKAKKEGDP